MSDSALLAFGGAMFFLVMAGSYVYLRSSIAPSPRRIQGEPHARRNAASTHG